MSSDDATARRVAQGGSGLGGLHAIDESAEAVEEDEDEEGAGSGHALARVTRGSRFSRDGVLVGMRNTRISQDLLSGKLGGETRGMTKCVAPHLVFAVLSSHVIFLDVRQDTNVL